MKKVISVILGIMIFAIPCFCFADSSPIILPVGNSETPSGYPVVTSASTQYFNATVSPTYIFIYQNPSATKPTILFFSESSDSVVNRFVNSNVTSFELSSEYNGFYYSYSPSSSVIDSSYIFYPEEDMTVTDIIDYIDNTVFSTTFDLSYLIDGSVSWLSSMAQAVKANGFLLFFCLVGFVGISIGLLERFKRG